MDILEVRLCRNLIKIKSQRLGRVNERVLSCLEGWRWVRSDAEADGLLVARLVYR